MIDGKRSRSRPEKSWMTNIEWTGMKVIDLIRSTPERERERERHGRLLFGKAQLTPFDLTVKGL